MFVFKLNDDQKQELASSKSKVMIRTCRGNGYCSINPTGKHFCSKCYIEQANGNYPNDIPINIVFHKINCNVTISDECARSISQYKLSFIDCKSTTLINSAYYYNCLFINSAQKNPFTLLCNQELGITNQMFIDQLIRYDKYGKLLYRSGELLDIKKDQTFVIDYNVDEVVVGSIDGQLKISNCAVRC